MANPYADTRAQDFAEERLHLGGFRCDRCGMVWPLPMYEQDGFKLCARDVDEMGRIEASDNIAASRAAAGNQPLTPLEIPPVGAFAGVSAVTRISPLSVVLQHGGASQVVTLTGVNLSASNVITYSEAHITSTNVVTSTSITLTITASGSAVAGDYDILFDSNILTPKGILKVR